MNSQLRIIFLGLTLSSSWGNGHATTYRALLKALRRQGHELLFLERDTPWYAAARDMPVPGFCALSLYRSVAELREEWGEALAAADAVIVGSYVPDGPAVIDLVLEQARGVTAFYDIDTPVTLARLARGNQEYLRPGQVGRFDYYLSFSGGLALEELKHRYGARRAEPFYCSVDPDLYRPVDDAEAKWDLGYLGTYSEDRQPPLDSLMLQAARDWPQGRFAVAGPQYPDDIAWPANVQRIDHLEPDLHCTFYNEQRFTLNITRADMVRLGHSPSVRLFEAAACGTPIVSDWWTGLDELLRPQSEILISRSAEETIRHLRGIPEDQRRAIGRRARERVLAEHTSEHRAEQLQALLLAVKPRLVTT